MGTVSSPQAAVDGNCASELKLRKKPSTVLGLTKFRTWFFSSVLGRVMQSRRRPLELEAAIPDVPERAFDSKEQVVVIDLKGLSEVPFDPVLNFIDQGTASIEHTGIFVESLELPLLIGHGKYQKQSNIRPIDDVAGF